uniref:Uncharacterized protein n=1 Tax=Quercus lobata TaxID=97700 RepID=A0A7N2LDV4_QUELO
MDAWYDVISYFKSDDFKRDPETQKELDDLQIWALAYCPKGQWAHDTPKHVYEEAKEKIVEMEVNEDRTLSSSERDTIFQSVVSMSSSKSRYVLGRGYMAKLPTSTERVRNELNSEVQSMKSQLDVERAERVAECA